MKESQKNNPLREVYLDDPQGVAITAEAIVSGQIVVMDHGTTFGTVFHPKIRKEVAKVRQETEPLAPVSLITTHSYARVLVDLVKLKPKIASYESFDKLRILESLCFVRFPIRKEKRLPFRRYFVENEEIQTFFVPEDDLLINHLKKRHRLPFFAVRSSNISGRPEEPYILGAREYAKEIGATVFALLSKNAEVAHANKLRIGSQPIIRLGKAYDPDESAEITLLRCGNTDKETIKRLLKEVLRGEVRFTHDEKKPVAYRKEYIAPDNLETAWELREHLLHVSGIERILITHSPR